MRVRLIKKQTIEYFVIENNQSKAPFERWILILKYADWEVLNDVKNTFGTADLLGNGTRRVVFNIGGNKYRTICKCQFGKRMVHLTIKWIGTHDEYTSLCSKGEQYSVNQF